MLHAGRGGYRANGALPATGSDQPRSSVDVLRLERVAIDLGMGAPLTMSDDPASGRDLRGPGRGHGASGVKADGMGVDVSCMGGDDL
jgi:hypothetical protein